MSNLLSYNNKRVVVTGCYSGMGEATARLLLRLGAEDHGIDYKDCSVPWASFTRLDLRDAAAIDDAASYINGVALPVDGGFMGGIATGELDLAALLQAATAAP